MPVDHYAAMTSDAQLVERSRHRDGAAADASAAFGALVARHQRLVFGVALARCGDPALAEDVAQEAFVAAWRDLDRLRDAERVGVWVAGIARNLAANAVRARARREQTVAEPADAAPSPEAHALEREDRELLVHALADIPAAYRETLVLFYVEGEAIARIALALGVTDDVIKQRLSRGRRALQKSVAARVETALSRARPGPMFGAAVVAALTTAGAKRAAAGKAMTLMSGKTLAVTAGVLAIAGGAMLWHHAKREPVHQATPAASAPAAPTRPSDHAPRVSKLPDKAARDALIAAIRKAHDARTASPPPEPAASPSSSEPAGSAPALADEDPDRDYVKSCMQDLIPLLTECYIDALARDPKIAGSITVDFTIEGEPGVGGVVSNSAVVPDQSQITDPGMRECIEQTMYSLEIDPPKNGGTVQVRYPFAFSSDAPAPPPKQ